MRKFLAAILLFFTFTTLCAEEMNLWCNDSGASEFYMLTVEEQYNSYINSFKKIKDPREQPMKWANRMVKQYGREVLPYFNRTLETLTLDHVYRKPYDSTIRCIQWLLNAFINNDILSENEKKLYTQILKDKIDLYIMKYKIIDGTVTVGYGNIRILDETYPFPWNAMEELKAEFESFLGIEIKMGDKLSTWED